MTSPKDPPDLLMFDMDLTPFLRMPKSSETKNYGHVKYAPCITTEQYKNGKLVWVEKTYRMYICQTPEERDEPEKSQIIS